MKLLLLPLVLILLAFDWLLRLVRRPDRGLLEPQAQHASRRHLLTHEPVVSAMHDLRLEAGVFIPTGEAVDLFRDDALRMPSKDGQVLAPLAWLPDYLLDRVRPESLQPLTLETALRYNGQHILLRARGTPEGVTRQLQACLEPGPTLVRQAGVTVAARHVLDDLCLHVQADVQRQGASLIGVISTAQLSTAIGRELDGLRQALEKRRSAADAGAYLPARPQPWPEKSSPLPCGDQLDISLMPACVQLRVTADLDGAHRALGEILIAHGAPRRDGAGDLIRIDLEDLPMALLLRHLPDPLTQLPLNVVMRIGDHCMDIERQGCFAQVARQLLDYVNSDEEHTKSGQERGVFAGGDFRAAGACISIGDLSYESALRVRVMSHARLRAGLQQELERLAAQLRAH